MKRLDESLSHKLTLVSAPAGFGKTIVLSEWARRAEQPDDDCPPTPVVWVSLDEGDDDPARFWSYVLGALERQSALCGAVENTAALLQASPPAVEPALTALINALAAQTSPAHFALVLDDYHAITLPVIHDTLAFLIDHLPPHVHLLLASRADPPLPLARLRAHNHLLELRATDLRFTLEETAAFLNDAMRLNLSPSDVAELETRAEGWIAGLQLAALAMQGRDSPTALVHTFTGDHHFVLEYLVEDVIGGQPEHVRRFFEHTSILDRLCGPLCEAVTGQPDGSATLARLWRDNLFTEPLDEVGQWYHCHRLFAEVMYAQLRRSQPALIPELHRRARDWYAGQGDFHAAMRHALASEQFEWAVETIEREYRVIVARGELATLRGWLNALPTDVVPRRPRLSLAYAWASAYTGRLDAIEGYLQQAEAAKANMPAAKQIAIHGEAVTLRAVIQSVGGDARRAIEDAREALALAPKDDAFLQMVAQHALGNSYRLLGRAIDAEDALLEAQRLGRPLAGLVMDTAVCIRLGQVQTMRGRLRQAVRSFETALRLGRASESLPNAGEAYVRMGDVYREWNDLDTAVRHVQKGIDIAQRAGNALALISGFLTLLRVQFARGETAAPREALYQAEQMAARYDFPHTTERLAAHQAWLNFVLGDFELAAQWADTYAATRSQADGRSGTLGDLQDTLLARIWLRQGRIDEAGHILSAVLRAAEAAGRGWTILQAQVLQALALQAQGRLGQALQMLEHTVLLASPEGYIRLFVDEGEPMRSLLERLNASHEGGGLKEYVHSLLDAIQAQPEIIHASAFTPQTLIAPLSARELEVLRLMAEGNSNQAIAAALVISLGTVKSHINRILGKLSARNRTEAVAHARSLGLL
jgi:LuxR family maltose regulon positive regulatory protein